MSIVEGSISVKAVLNSRYRKVNKIYINYDKHSSDISFICQKAAQCHIEVERCTASEIDKLASGKSHGGILADVSERKTQSLSALLYKDKPWLAFLEGVEDSYNLGYMLRTLYAFGFDGVILKERYYNFDDTTIIRSSAGASELMPICFVDDIESSLLVLKNNNVKIVSAYRGNNPIDLYKYDFKDTGLLICVGGALRGLSKAVLNNSDGFVYIPYGNDFRNALNGASAVSVIASEVYRQNKE